MLEMRYQASVGAPGTPVGSDSDLKAVSEPPELLGQLDKYSSRTWR